MLSWSKVKEPDSETLACLNQVTPQPACSPRTGFTIQIPHPSGHDPFARDHLGDAAHVAHIDSRAPSLSPHEPLGGRSGVGGPGCVPPSGCGRGWGLRVSRGQCTPLPGCVGTGTLLSCCVRQWEAAGNQPAPSRGRETRAGPARPRPQPPEAQTALPARARSDPDAKAPGPPGESAPRSPRRHTQDAREPRPGVAGNTEGGERVGDPAGRTRGRRRCPTRTPVAPAQRGGNNMAAGRGGAGAGPGRGNGGGA